MGGVASATGRITRAALVRLPAPSTAKASRNTESVGRAAALTSKLNATPTEFCAGEIARVSVSVAAPETVKPTDAMPPRSLATTTAVACCPGRTRSPVETPEMLVTGGVASVTVSDSGTACEVCPCVSTALAWIWIVDPGAAVMGTLNAKVSVRDVDRRLDRAVDGVARQRWWSAGMRSASIPDRRRW